MLDKIDRKLLALLQQDCTLSLQALAEAVNLTTTPCWKRLKRLEDDGILIGKVALLDPEKIGLGLTAFVLIKTQHHSSEWYCRFVTVVTEMPEVLGFWRMAGEYDYLMRVQVADMKRYDEFYKRLVNSVPGLSDVTSSFAMEQIKYTTSLPIEYQVRTQRVRLFAQLSWYFRREWRRYLGAVALLVIIAMLQLVPPKVVGIVVDGVTEQHFTTGQILMWIATMVLIAVVVYLLRYVWRVLLFGASYQLAVELREDYYRQLSRQHPEFYLRHRTGDLMARATNDVDRVVFAAGEGVLTLVDSLVMGCAVLIMMSTQISWQLTLFALLPMPVMAIMIKRNGDALHERFKLAQAAFSSLNDRTQESLTSIRMIKAFGLEDRQSALFAADAEDTGKKNMRVARIDARFDPTIYIAIGMANLLAIGGGSWMVAQGSLTLGQLTSFMMYLGLMIWPMLALAWMFNIVERGSAAYSRIRAMLAEAPVVNDGSEPVPEGRGELDVNIHQFTYPQTDHPALENVNFALKPGQMLGICGPTGSGKSTLLSLIQRHFDVSEGDIRFHDIPLTKLQLDSWRSRLAVVSQTPFLFSDTVANNIALGCPNATQQEIEHVARLASVHDDILRLPQGYDTEVGERGVMLSGGQKQRISIARALLVNAEILILDDALSAVDGRTEHQILHNLRQWGQGRTVIISAHRLSALTEASEIIVMQHGHIAQRGNHDELAQQSGWYRDMYRYQQLEAALDDAPEIREEAVDA
ncbi:SmdA family multidrug ABC transporter permease/ATP-binding protein [Escherichia coli]|nr:SmdA family multidrug ABC transporter permease/ATP-binding protein [Escherichia coli]BCM44293.1 multidrug ABC transporter ATPase [Escherichia coli]BCM46095.1 multidrug ABC transporter ATPase [Escherichia coli]